MVIAQIYSMSLQVQFFVAALSQKLILELTSFAKEVNLDILIEVRNRAKLDRDLELGTVRLLALYNRNLHDFTTTVETT